MPITPESMDRPDRPRPAALPETRPAALRPALTCPPPDLLPLSSRRAALRRLAVLSAGIATHRLLLRAAGGAANRGAGHAVIGATGAIAALGPGLVAPASAQARADPGVLRVTAIPDEAPTELLRKFRPLGEHLQRALGLRVDFVPATDYAATVEALVAGRVDLAWLGGFTLVQARVRSGGQVVPIVQRVEDQNFRSVFIARADAGIRALADLRGRTLSFGSVSSTSGHLMPRHFLLQAGIDPDRDLRRIAYSGAHDATALAVAGGRVDAGVLNQSVWDKLVAEGRVDAKAVTVFFVTPGYHDYNWSVRADMPADRRERLVRAFLDLDPRAPADRAILELQRTARFIPTQAANYAQIEQVARAAGLLK